MAILEFEYLGESFLIDVSPKAKFVFGVRKSGSTLLNETIGYLARGNNINMISIPDKLFQKNIDFESDFSSYIPDRIIHHGNVYGGFRRFPRNLLNSTVFGESQKVLLLRDPRDALVSQYFSIIKSHYIPEGDQSIGPRNKLMQLRKNVSDISIDEFVISEAPSMNQTIMEYKHLLHDKGSIILKYEDIIYNKNEFMTILCEHFGWTVSYQGRLNILHHIDIRPNIEDETSFIRKVSPGDHIQKLKPQTIKLINNLLSEAMDTFSYPKEADIRSF